MSRARSPRSRARRTATARLGAVALALVSLACGEPQGRAGTNTNWLRRCADDAECGDTLVCSCGRCTALCFEADDCAKLAGTCATAAAAALQCRDRVAAALCLGTCAADPDCAAGQLCRDGTCVDAMPAGDCAKIPDALACADFESSLGDGTAVVTDGNTLEVTSGGVPSGEAALDARVTVTPASVAYLRSDFPAQTEGALYLRGWFQVPAGVATFNLAPFGLWATGEVDWALRLVVTQGATELWSYTTPAASAVPVAVGEWHCVEMAVTLDDVAGTASVSVDGVALLDVTALDTLPEGGIDGLAMGTVWALEAAAVRIDRVALATSPVGCWD